MAVASLSLQNLARNYGKVRAVDDLSVEVPDGEHQAAPCGTPR